MRRPRDFRDVRLAESRLGSECFALIYLGWSQPYLQFRAILIIYETPRQGWLRKVSISHQMPHRIFEYISFSVLYLFFCLFPGFVCHRDRTNFGQGSWMAGKRRVRRVTRSTEGLREPILISYQHLAAS